MTPNLAATIAKLQANMDQNWSATYEDRYEIERLSRDVNMPPLIQRLAKLVDAELKFRRLQHLAQGTKDLFGL